MSATILHINKRQRPNPLGWVRLADFETVEGAPISAEYVLKRPQVSLYCLDHENKRFIFTESDPDIDLTQAPFFFQAQFEHAQRLIAVPYEEMHALIDERPYADEQIILLYSVGRCGSTLMSEVFNHQEDVISLSEPDIFTDLLKMRQPDGSNDDLIKRLLKTSMLSLMKPMPHKQATKYAIKFRSYGIELAELIAELFPKARNLFMYRNAEDWARSTARAFQKLESEKGSVGSENQRRWAQRREKLRSLFGDDAPAPVQKIISRMDGRAGVLSQRALALRSAFFPALKNFETQLQNGELSRIEYITIEWVSGICRFWSCHEKGIHMLPFRYEELVADPRQILSEIFVYCDLPETAVADALPIFEKDSQRGTEIARTAVQHDSANRLTEAHLTQLHALIEKFPEIESADVILPGTIGRMTFKRLTIDNS